MATEDNSGSGGANEQPERVGGAEAPPNELMQESDNRAAAGDNPSKDIWVPALKEAGVAFAAAAVLLVIFYALAFRWIHPEFVPFMDRDATKLIAPGKDLIPVSVAGYRVEGRSAIIEDFNGDEAILALPRSFQAEDYPFIKVNLSGFTRYSRFKILWRRADDPSQTHALEFNRSGDEVTQIAMVYGNENYRGRIADIALLFYDGPALGFENNNDVDLSIQSIELRPFSAWRVVQQILEDWSNPPLLQGYSNNIVKGIHENGMLSPNGVANLVVITGALLVLIHRTVLNFQQPTVHKTSILLIAICLCLYGWVPNSALRWHWRVAQLVDSHERYEGMPLAQKIRNNPLRCARSKEDCRADLLPYF